MATLTCSPTTMAVGATAVTVTLTGTGTSWTVGSPGSPTFTQSKANSNDSSISNQHVVSTTTAQLTMNAGGTDGIITITDPSTAATCTITVGAGITPIARVTQVTAETAVNPLHFARVTQVTTEAAVNPLHFARVTQVFVEAAVNPSGIPPVTRRRTSTTFL